MSLLELYPIISPIIHVNKFDNGSVITFLQEDSSLVLNGSETLILFMCDGTKKISELIFQISKIYSTTIDSVSKQIIEFLDNAVERKLIFYSEEIVEISYKHVLALEGKFENNDKENIIYPQNILSISVSIVEECPLRCIYCSQEANVSTLASQFIPLEDIERILTEAYKMGARYFNITGGEPMIHPDIIEIVSLAYSIGFSEVLLSTKATTISLEDAKALRTAGISKLQVSIDSFEPTVYDKMVGVKGKYSDMIQGVHHLRQCGIEVTINSVLTKINIDSIFNRLDLLKVLGISKWHLDVVMPTGRAQKNLLPTRDQISELENQIEKIQDIKVKLSYQKKNEVKKCASLLNALEIASNGSVLACDKAVSVKEFDLGNIYEASIYELWNSKAVNEIRKKRKSNEECKKCSSLLCQGGCILNSYLATNDYFGGDTSCKYIFRDSKELPIVF